VDLWTAVRNCFDEPHKTKGRDMKLRTITGSLSAWGSYESDRYGTTKYDYLRFTTNDGSDGYFQNVLSLPLTDSLLNGGGGSRTYYFAPVALPKMFGSLHCNVLYAVRDQGRITDARAAAGSAISKVKLEALKLFFYGTLALIIPPIGIIMWIWGLRLLSMGLPAARMREELQRSAV
jgi:hypothetical protein